MTVRSWSRSWRPTYGCIVYQEQVMQIVREPRRLQLLGRSDLLRRAMSKKKATGDVRQRERQNFVYGR